MVDLLVVEVVLVEVLTVIELVNLRQLTLVVEVVDHQEVKMKLVVLEDQD